MKIPQKKNLAIWFYTTKVFAGTSLGVLFGFTRISEIIALAISILTISIIILFFRFGLGFEDHPLKIILWHGTASYFITIIAFWAIIYNMFYC